jgi:hypothetical protein
MHFMLVKINGIEGNKVRVTELDIDSYGSIIPLRNLELKLPDNDYSIARTLRSSSHAAIFTQGNVDDNYSIIILATGLSQDELNEEKRKIIEATNKQPHS